MKNRPPLAIEALLWPPAMLYRGVMNLRNEAFERGYFLSHGVPARVLSIGNLTAGGTGKTPLTAFLVKGFLAHGKNVGLVSRGYGGTERGPARVASDGSPATARRFGDEPAWLASVFPNVAVVVGADRVAAAKKLVEDEDVDLILADDAFQHRRLQRRMDAIVLDASEPRWHYRTLPLGRMREGFSALSRCHAIFVTKTNLASADDLIWLRRKIDTALDRFQVPPFIFEMESLIHEFKSVEADSTVPASDLQGVGVLLVSGIGRPAAFRSLMEKTGAKILGHIECPDHHKYSEADFKIIREQAATLKADAVVMTEKDAVKIGAQLGSELPCYVSRLEMQIKTARGGFSIEDFYEAFDRAVF